jgi:activating signal cointegrator complex subunit 3
VGLSATLPNYQDVAAFLRVNPRTGLHYFGPEFRPIPLAQTFLGVPEKQRVKRNDIMNRLAYEKMVEALKRGKQVMIFVHARKETVKTAEAMADLSGKYCSTDLLLNHEHERYTLWKRQVDKSRSRELQQLFAKGLGVHHAGMLRADRTLTEQLFEAGLVKVLCCTATLAWGVNLPAHTVIIKGSAVTPVLAYSSTARFLILLN